LIAYFILELPLTMWEPVTSAETAVRHI